MVMTPYRPDESVRAARARYFDTNGFGADGGYGDAWVEFAFGPVPLPIPNTAGRVRAVRYHDLHHIVTGYETDMLGEFEISAWELGAGCGDFYAAWFINLGGLAGGAVLAPIRTFRAFVRGRGSRSLYSGYDVDALLDGTVAALREAAVLPATPPTARPADVALFLLFALAGLSTWGVMLVPGVVLGPLLAIYLRGKRDREQAGVHAE